MDFKAEQELNEMFNPKAKEDALGKIMIMSRYDNTIQLNMAEAKKLFAMLYEEGNSYDYDSHISNNQGKFIEHHVILFLKILVNCSYQT